MSHRIETFIYIERVDDDHGVLHHCACECKEWWEEMKLFNFKVWQEETHNEDELAMMMKVTIAMMMREEAVNVFD